MNWIPIAQIATEEVGPNCDTSLRLQLAQLFLIVADICPDAVGRKREKGEWVFEPKSLPVTQKKEARNLLTIWPSRRSVRLEFYPEPREYFDQERLSSYQVRLREVYTRILLNHDLALHEELSSLPTNAPSREFRSPASYEAEAKTRDMIVPFLAARGFDDLQESRPLHGKVQSQVIKGITPNREPITLRIRLCWRKERSDKARSYSAAQIIPTVQPGRWNEALTQLVDRHTKEGVTHLLLVQREDEEITLAACIPIRELPSVWQAQRDESARLIATGMMGKRSKNHAENGSSPTLWLEDEKAPSVAELLWRHRGVTDLAQLPLRALETFSSEEVFDTGSFDEGALIEITIQKRERSSRLRELARSHFAQQSPGGRLRCSVCAWSPPLNTTLDLSGPIVEIHHETAISTLPTEGRSLIFTEAIKYLTPLCPNCHRMIHAKRDGGAFSLDQLRTSLGR